MRNNMTIVLKNAYNIFALKTNKYRIYLVVLEFVDTRVEIEDSQEVEDLSFVEIQDTQEELQLAGDRHVESEKHHVPKSWF